MRRVRKPLKQALTRTITAREPDLGLAALLKAVEGRMASNRQARARIIKSSLPKAHKARRRNLAAAKRQAARENKQSIAARARERSALGLGFKGPRHQRTGLMPIWAEALADAPDEPFPLVNDKCAAGTLKIRGWVQHHSGVVLRYDLPPINKRSGYRARAAQTYVLTDDGKLVRSWLQWVRARRVMGWPCPMFGKRGEFVGHWLRGEDLPKRRLMTWMATAGYLPGDAADEAWPGLWEAGCGLESGSGVP